MITRANFRAMVWAVVLAALFVAACGSSDGIADARVDRPTGDLGFADDEPRPDADPNASSGEPGFGSSPPTTAGSGLPPVTTIPALPGGTLDGYTGVLGRLRADEVVAEPIAPPPARSDGIMPLTGLPGEVPQRPAAVVKIDNGSAAVPQTGLNSADIVIEEEVEGGVTRFAAIFHSTPSIVGPVRSGRTTDVGLISGLGSPLLLYSGANDLTEIILRRQPHIQNHSHSTSSGYWRDDSRNAPSNLYTDTAPHWASAVGSAPPPQFEYRADDDSVGGSAVESFSIDYPASAASWKWQDGQWERHQRGARHDLVGGRPVTAANIVVVEAQRVGTGMFDSAGGPVPEFVFVGTGPATVFTDGRRVDGVWTRPTLVDVATLTDGNGRVIRLTPGRTWIQLIEVDSGYLR